MDTIREEALHLLDKQEEEYSQAVERLRWLLGEADIDLTISECDGIQLMAGAKLYLEKLEGTGVMLDAFPHDVCVHAFVAGNSVRRWWLQHRPMTIEEKASLWRALGAFLRGQIDPDQLPEPIPSEPIQGD